jgi:N-carbamoyl-L-amino-acid hydrolase
VKLNNMSTRKEKDRQPVSSQRQPDCHGSTWIKERILELAEHSDPEAAGHTRLAFSRQDRQARETVSQFMKDAGLTVRIDPAANIIGRRDGARPDAPVIMAGSHIDTVKEGGRFDGVAGVIAAIAAVRSLRERQLTTQHPLEVVVFTSEEPNEFGVSTVGSRAMAGTLDAKLLPALRNKDGLTLAEAVNSVGGDARSIARAARRHGEILAYLELHIEQGPVLDGMGIPIGVVTGIAGFARGQVTVTGRADHAGTTPMDTRRDALTASAELILALERIASRKSQRGTVATVGVLHNSPNAANVVPGRVTLVTDIRSTQLKLIERAERAFQQELHRIAAARAMDIAFDPLNRSLPVAMDGWVMGLLQESCRACGTPYHLMPSGAGHDASHLSGIARAGMVFVPSRLGRSHCPEEWTDFEHIALGAQVLEATILKIDERAKEVHGNG